MPALQGYEEVAAARLTVDFMKELAKNLEAENTVLGFWRRYKFRGGYRSNRLFEEESEPLMSGRFFVDVRSRRLARKFRREASLGWLYKTSDWLPFAYFSLHRID